MIDALSFPRFSLGELLASCIAAALISIACFVVAWHVRLSLRDRRAELKLYEYALEYRERQDVEFREHQEMRRGGATVTPKSFGRRA